MPAESVPRLVAQLWRASPSSDGDGDLLQRFITDRDEAAFTTLVRRHGPMVMGVCRRVLGNDADAEDACQATFLVLVRKAASIRPRGSVGGWLHGVAHNTARRARRMAARRRQHEQNAGHAPRAVGPDPELRAAIDRELDRLPERYRSPVVLCDLEGMTRTEAARHLGWAEGTVASRLSRARRMLARRLSRAGLGVPAGGLGVLIGLPMTVSAAQLESIYQTAVGRSTAPEAILNLTSGVLRTMTLKRYALATTLLLSVGIVGLTVREAMPTVAGQAPPAKSAAKGSDTAPVAKDAEGDVTVQNVPPVVVKTVPAAGADDVDPALSEIKVTFSKDMLDQSWSWSQLSEETNPKTVGDKPVHYEKDKRTCVLKVKLEPGKTYGFWLNSEKFGNFKDADGRSAVPYLLVFKTKKTD
jgi:RNA polymerase sigma factor (sigma-70 family)